MKKPLCTGNLLPALKIFIKRPVIVPTWKIWVKFLHFLEYTSTGKMRKSIWANLCIWKLFLRNLTWENCKPRATPYETYSSFYHKDEANGDVINKKYWEMMGSLVHYSMICTQPDLSYVVTKLSQHLSKPNRSDYWVLLKHAFQYIKGSVNYCLSFQKGHLNLSAHCDADWASSLENRHTILGYYFMLPGNGPQLLVRN